ncbi:MAG: YfiR family protein, partial [Mariprofundales bacterium]
CALLLCANVTPITFAEEIDESLLQMLYLRNFIAYSKWPQSHAPTVLAIVGGSALQPTIATMQQQHAFSIDTIRYCDGAGSCAVGADVVFIGRSFNHSQALLQQLAAHHILTVSNQAEFIDHGGVIGMIRRNHRLRFEINLTAAHQAKLHISGELLQMATRIIGSSAP